MMNKSITVFTPTYNRAHLIHHLYESLLRQSCQDFKWLVIDDGSTDNTREIIENWIEEGKLDISYIYKDNGGLHSGYNTAIAHIDTELSICIDSDDWMPDKAIERILVRWNDYRDNNRIAGLIGLDYGVNGHLIGGHLKNGLEINPVRFLASCTNRGDKKYVVRTSCYKEMAPMPEYKGERNFNPHYLILKMSEKYRFIAMDEALCIVDYQPDGMTANQFKQYLDSPQSFAELRRMILSLPNVPLLYMLKTVIHYCSSSQLAGNINYIKESPKPLLTVIFAPAGHALTSLIRFKAKQ